MELIKLNTFIKSSKDWSFGDIILFQEYERIDSEDYGNYNIAGLVLSDLKLYIEKNSGKHTQLV